MDHILNKLFSITFIFSSLIALGQDSAKSNSKYRPDNDTILPSRAFNNRQKQDNLRDKPIDQLDTNKNNEGSPAENPNKTESKSLNLTEKKQIIKTLLGTYIK